jgi:phage-related protein
MAAKAKEAGKNFLNNLVDFIKNAPERIGYFIGMVIGKVASFVVNMAIKAKEAGTKFFNNLVNFFKNLPSNVWTWLQNTIAKVKSWATTMQAKAKDTGSKVVSNVVNFFKQLPGKTWTWLKNTVNKVAEFGRNAVTKAKTAAKDIKDAVVNGVKTLPDKIKTVGKDLVRGLWNGISNMTDWVLSKIKSFGSSVLNGIKDYFKIKSPSRVFRDEVGAMLAEGMAVGIEDNADAPLDAMAAMSEGVLDEAGALNGITMERQLNHTFAAQSAAAQAEAGLLGLLDKILAAIERGQVIAIDGKTLVGATVGYTDQALGLRRDLIARGAL